MIASHQSYFSFIYFLFSYFFFFYTFYFRTLLLSGSLEQNATRWCRRSRVHVRVADIYTRTRNILYFLIIMYRPCARTWLVLRCCRCCCRCIIFILHYVLRVNMSLALRVRVEPIIYDCKTKKSKQKIVRSNDDVSGTRWYCDLEHVAVPTG